MTNLIHIGSLTFNAEDRDTWSAMELQGWKGSPPMRADVTDRPNQDGAFGAIRHYRSARALLFRGVFEGGTLAVQQGLEDQFAAIQADGAPLTLSVENDLGVRSVTASLQGDAEVVVDPDHFGATVTARFICPDPIKYGPEVQQQTGLPVAGGGLEYELGEPAGALYYGSLGVLGRVTLTNTGTADTWPRFVVTGQLDSGFLIQRLDTGDMLRYDRVVPAGSTVTIDSRTGEVLVDGVSDASTYLTMDGFFPAPAGVPVEVQFSALGSASGSPTMTVHVRSGWW